MLSQWISDSMENLVKFGRFGVIFSSVFAPDLSFLAF